ncbi:plasmid mobilization protein [Caballeronia grimmiae]|uniref:plasmid mobilization protein n=1 Tax=Caballeronia grimmiae TaxID=1071679 RepID=UPI0038BD6545
MPFVQNGLEALDSLISLRLTTREKAKLKEDADLAGLSVSELVRRRYFGRPIVANANAIMIKELRRLGGLLKHVHVESDGAYSRETAEALLAVKTCVEKMSAKPNDSTRDRASKKAES